MKILTAVLLALGILLVLWMSELGRSQPLPEPPRSAASPEAVDELTDSASIVVERAPASPDPWGESSANAALPGDADRPSRDSIVGRVVDGAGIPQPGVRVSLWRNIASNVSVGMSVEWPTHEPPRQSILAQQFTDAGGGFRFLNIGIDPCGLTAVAGSQAEHRFPIAPGSFVEIAFGAGCSVEGTIRCHGHETESFRGVAWLTLRSGGTLELSAPLQSDGGFRLSGIPPGEYIVLAMIEQHALGMKLVILQARGDAQPVEVQTEPAVQASGLVLSAETGTPIAEAVVAVPGSFASALTDAQGEFRILGIGSARTRSSKPLTLLADAEGYLTESLPWTLDEELIFKLHSNRDALPFTLSGRIVNEARQPLAGMSVMAQVPARYVRENPLSAKPQRSISGADGRFSLRWREDADCTLDIHDTGNAHYLMLLGRVAGSRELGDLVMPQTTELQFVVLDEARQAVESARLHLSRGVSLPESRFQSENFQWGPLFLSSPGQALTDSYGR